MANSQTSTGARSRRAFLGSAAGVTAAGAVMVPALASIHASPNSDAAICALWQDWRSAYEAWAAACTASAVAEDRFRRENTPPRVRYGTYRDEPDGQPQPYYLYDEGQIRRFSHLGPADDAAKAAIEARLLAEFGQERERYQAAEADAIGHLEARATALGFEEETALNRLLSACSASPAAIAARLDMAHAYGGSDLDWDAKFVTDYPRVFLRSILADLVPVLPGPMADYFRARLAEGEGSANA